MKMRTISSVLAACTVTLASGVALSGGTATSVNKLVDYDERTGELYGIPAGGSVQSYLHTSSTVHERADLRLYQPPDPCLPLASVWNISIEHLAPEHVFSALLFVMSAHGCSATVTSVTNGSPQVMVRVRPSP